MSGPLSNKDFSGAPIAASDAFTAEDIHEQLERILASEQFRDSLRLTRFLRFVIETALSGKTEYIKAYTIATQALSRDSDFDPQTDPIVRVEAGRLRQALARYYADSGRDDPLAIDLPRGTYVPCFSSRDAPPRASAPEGEKPLATSSIGTVTASLPAMPSPRSQGRRPVLRGLPAWSRSRPLYGRIFGIAFMVLAVLAILEVLFDIDRPLVGGPNHGLWYRLWPSQNAVASQPRVGDGAPIIYVEPVTTVGHEVAGLFPAKAIRERLTGALALYDDVTVVTSEPEGASGQERPRSIYRLAATVRYGDDAASLIVQLLDAANNSIAWSRQYERSVKTRPGLPKGSIAPDVARSLLDPFGVIQARERIKLASDDPMRDTYRCVLDANVYLRSFNPAQYQPVHDCLVRAAERDARAVTAYADLAFVYLRNYRFGIGAPPGDPITLDAASAMASRAVDIKPESAFAQYALAAALLAKGDIARAKIASEKSYALNPGDGAVAFGRATTLVLTGEVDAGLALLDKNAINSPNSWIGYHLVKALGCYLKGDFATAAAESRQIANPFFPPGLMLDAVIANKAGDRARAQQDIAMLYQFYPAWREHFRASVGRFLPEPAMADRIAADFKTAAGDTEQ